MRLAESVWSPPPKVAPWRPLWTWAAQDFAFTGRWWWNNRTWFCRPRFPAVSGVLANRGNPTLPDAPYIRLSGSSCSRRSARSPFGLRPCAGRLERSILDPLRTLRPATPIAALGRLPPLDEQPHFVLAGSAYLPVVPCVAMLLLHPIRENGVHQTAGKIARYRWTALGTHALEDRRTSGRRDRANPTRESRA